MITTLFLLLFLGFLLWQLSSGQAGNQNQPAYLQKVLRSRRTARMIGTGCILLALFFFIRKLGIASGSFAAIVGLMGIGSVMILLRPFRIINITFVALLYAVFVCLEIFL